MRITEKFWRWLALFAWRRWQRHFPNDQMIPDGVPGIRDVNNRCPIFEPRKPMRGDLTDCQGDGHYLCQECCHMDPEVVEGTLRSQVS